MSVKIENTLNDRFNAEKNSICRSFSVNIFSQCSVFERVEEVNGVSEVVLKIKRMGE